uniref:Uncharacterized protein n=1 Tax=Cucumis melo TaxID=3656 RepID=A0A9I9CTT8_CUCME
MLGNSVVVCVRKEVEEIYGFVFLATGTWAVVAVVVAEAENLTAFSFSLLAVHIHTMAKVTTVMVAEEEQFLCDKEKAMGDAGLLM